MKHSVPFCSAVRAVAMTDYTKPEMTKYRDFFYQHFEMAVLENKLKWAQIEKKKVGNGVQGVRDVVGINVLIFLMPVCCCRYYCWFCSLFIYLIVLFK